MTQSSWRRLAVLLPLLALATAAPARAQVRDTAASARSDTVRPLAPRDTARAARNARAAAAVPDTAKKRISPRTAFLRSLVLPGWGQSSIGAPGRGAVYFGLEAGSLWMLYKSDQKLQEARIREQAQHDQGTLAPDARTGLVKARRNEREDWITLSGFWLFFSGADAFVSAYLRDFDAHVGVAPAPQGGAQVQVSVPVGN